MKKWILSITFFAIIALIIVFLSLNSIVKNAIIRIGSDMTKVPVKVASVSLMPISGFGSINGIDVENPQEYQLPTAIQIDEASIHLSPLSLTKEKIIIYSIDIKRLAITLEGSISNNNLTAILDNINARPDKSTRKKAKKNTTEEVQKKSAQLQIDSITISDATVYLELSILRGETATITLDDIHLTHLGQGPEGITSAEVTSQLLDQILSQTTIAIPGIIVEISAKKLNISPKNADKIESAVKSIGGFLKNLGK